MAKETAQDRREPADVQALDLLQNACGFEITRCEENLFLENRERYTKLNLAPAQKIQISGLLQQLPQAAAAGAMTQMYVARFPEGLPHTLTALRQGGVGSMIQGADGRIGGMRLSVPCPRRRRCWEPSRPFQLSQDSISYPKSTVN